MDVTQLLTRVTAGDSRAAGEIFPLVYDNLRAIAGSYFRHQQADQTLQPTALVHEAFLKLVDQTQVRWNDRPHFFALAATAMRQILADHARQRRSLKRGGDRRRVDLTVIPGAENENPLDLVALDDALTKLAALDSRQARLVELRFFGGLTNEEAAGVLNVSLGMVEKEWRRVRAWLGRELGTGSAP